MLCVEYHPHCVWVTNVHNLLPQKPRPGTNIHNWWIVLTLLPSAEAATYCKRLMLLHMHERSLVTGAWPAI